MIFRVAPMHNAVYLPKVKQAYKAYYYCYYYYFLQQR